MIGINRVGKQSLNLTRGHSGQGEVPGYPGFTISQGEAARFYTEEVNQNTMNDKDGVNTCFKSVVRKKYLTLNIGGNVFRLTSDYTSTSDRNTRTSPFPEMSPLEKAQTKKHPYGIRSISVNTVYGYEQLKNQAITEPSFYNKRDEARIYITIRYTNMDDYAIDEFKVDEY